MESIDALAALSALGQDTRLTLFRALVAAEPQGLLAGDLAARTGLKPNTASVNLAILQAAGLVVGTREGRGVRYRAALGGLGALVGFLTDDCCGGRPDLCPPAAACAGTAAGAPDTTLNVLFLCTGNSARSIMAEAILNRLGGGRFAGFSAGSHPAGQVQPLALDLLHRNGCDTGRARAKSWDEFAGPDAPQMDFVFTVCDAAAAEACPAWPGHPVTANWGVPDPVAAPGGPAEKALAFAETWRLLSQRIGTFVALPLPTLSRMALEVRVRAIGAAGAAA